MDTFTIHEDPTESQLTIQCSTPSITRLLYSTNEYNKTNECCRCSTPDSNKIYDFYRPQTDIEIIKNNEYSFTIHPEIIIEDIKKEDVNEPSSPSSPSSPASPRILHIHSTTNTFIFNTANIINYNIVQNIYSNDDAIKNKSNTTTPTNDLQNNNSNTTSPITIPATTSAIIVPSTTSAITVPPTTLTINTSAVSTVPAPPSLSSTVSSSTPIIVPTPRHRLSVIDDRTSEWNMYEIKKAKIQELSTHRTHKRRDTSTTVIKLSTSKPWYSIFCCSTSSSVAASNITLTPSPPSFSNVTPSSPSLPHHSPRPSISLYDHHGNHLIPVTEDESVLFPTPTLLVPPSTQTTSNISRNVSRSYSSCNSHSPPTLSTLLTDESQQQSRRRTLSNSSTNQTSIQQQQSLYQLSRTELTLFSSISFSSLTPLKGSILSKRSYRHQRWHRHLFVLSKYSYLFYFNSIRDNEPCGVLNIINCSVQEEKLLSIELCKKNNRSIYCFSMTVEQGYNLRYRRLYKYRTYYFSTENYNDMSDWMFVLSNAESWITNGGIQQNQIIEV